MTAPDEIQVPCGATIYGEERALEHEDHCPDCRASREAQPVGPDCRDGKHAACHGDAWDEVNDRLTDCACCANGHQAAFS